MSIALRTFHKLPPSSRSLVASLRGLYLKWWRYDGQTDRLVEEALERDYWSPKEWSEWRARQLSYVLDRAARTVPYYRLMWTERRKNGDKASWEYLENWPILEKKELRNFSPQFVADDCSRSRMFHEHTSGTTGTSLDLWLTGQTVKRWYALFEARCRRWHGLSRHDRWAILGGQVVARAGQRTPPFWVWNSAMKQLYMSVYHLSPDCIGAYLDALKRYRVKYVLGYPSAIYAIAHEALKRNRSDVKLEVVMTNAEPLYGYQREAISAAFSCPVRETYGMAEIAAAASECGHGRLHQWPDAGHIECDMTQTGDGDPHDLICTGLLNTDMPLVRYHVGDTGRFSGSDTCECGRTLPVLDAIEGRIDDVLFTTDGRRIGRLDPIFKSGLPIVEAQLIQKSLRKIQVRYVPAADFKRDALKVLSGLIRDRMGDVEVMFEELELIPRTSRGKFRAVICELAEQEKADLASG